MKHGFLKVAAATPKVKIADCTYNTDELIKIAKDAEKDKIKVLIFPELSITAYSCADMFFSHVLINAAKENLKRYIKETASLDLLSVVGLPIFHCGKLYNCAAVVKSGKLLAFVPKTNIPSYNEFSEGRYFMPAPENNSEVDFFGEKIVFGKNVLFSCNNMQNLTLGIEICEDIWVPVSPSSILCQAGATVLANLSTSSESIDKDEYRRLLVKAQSGKTLSGYIYADSGEGESTSDTVCSGHSIIAEDGKILAERLPFDYSGKPYIVTEFDLQRIYSSRIRMGTYPCNVNNNIITLYFDFAIDETKITRFIDPRPFAPEDKQVLKSHASFVRSVQGYALKQRLEATHIEKSILGISGGLDSCLALLSTAYTYDLMGKDRKNIIAVTMPCFGTTSRTKTNAQILSEELGVDFREVDISEAVRIHFRDIAHDESNHNIVFENAQARERTQVLMDIANAENALVIGTGDLSELALGWSTFNGDHMSMYGLNASLPKTFVRHMVSFYADEYRACGNDKLADAICDILNTPVSPELLPAKNGKIAQKTEDIVGPYELHDFFIFHTVKYQSAPDKIFRLAKHAFAGEYDDETILKWLKVFFRRFFTQQFKRSCSPDSPKIGTVGLSPRGDFKLPSDACISEWQRAIDKINI